MTTKVVIEGRPPIDVPPEIAGNDQMIIASLTPLYPQAAEAEMRRETTAEGDVLIHLTPVGKAKGAGASPAPPEGELPISVYQALADRLAAARPYRNPVIKLANQLADEPITDEASLLNQFDKINPVLRRARSQIAYTEQLAQALADAPSGLPLPVVPLGL